MVALQTLGVCIVDNGVGCGEETWKRRGGDVLHYSGTCLMCMQVGLSLDPVRRLDQGGVQCPSCSLSLDDSHFGCWHVMFASCCISGAEESDSSICTVPMVIRKYSSVRNKYWPEDQQVNFAI